MRLTLPRLDATDPADLLAALRGTTPLPRPPKPRTPTGPRRWRPASPTPTPTWPTRPGGCSRRSACSTASPTRTSWRLFSAVEGVPGRFAGISRDEWSAVLDDAARVGLLTALGAGMYQVHPALPGYLAAGWHAEDPAGYDQERQASEQALRAACAAFARWLTGQIASGDAALAYTLLGWQRRTLGAMLGHALDHHAWADAEGIIRALDAYWDARGLSAEAAAWADRVLDATAGPGQAPPESASSLWLYTTVHQATRQKNAGQPDQAAQAYRRALAYLHDQPATDWTRGNIAVISHQLGMTAQARGRLDEAQDWYRKSLAINEELGNRPGMASTYAQLGLLAETRQQGPLPWHGRSGA